MHIFDLICLTLLFVVLTVTSTIDRRAGVISVQIHEIAFISTRWNAFVLGLEITWYSDLGELYLMCIITIVRCFNSDINMLF